MKHPAILKMERQIQMRKINAARQVPLTKKFDGITYHLAHSNLYKGQAEHYASAVRAHGGLARVVPGKVGAGSGKISGWRVYTRE